MPISRRPRRRRLLGRPVECWLDDPGGCATPVAANIPIRPRTAFRTAQYRRRRRTGLGSARASGADPSLAVAARSGKALALDGVNYPTQEAFIAICQNLRRLGDSACRWARFYRRPGLASAGQCTCSAVWAERAVRVGSARLEGAGDGRRAARLRPAGGRQPAAQLYRTPRARARHIRTSMLARAHRYRACPDMASACLGPTGTMTRSILDNAELLRMSGEDPGVAR
jgi:hypothetical protein